MTDTTDPDRTEIRTAILTTLAETDELVTRDDLPAVLSDDPDPDSIEPVVDQLIRDGEIYAVELKNDTMLKKT
jgi:hypothetical protein